MEKSKKQQEIENYLSEPIEVGEIVIYNDKTQKRPQGDQYVEVSAIDDTYIYFKKYGYPEPQKWLISDVTKDTSHIGANPFADNNDGIRPIAFALDSILFNLNILGEKESDGKYIFNGVKCKSINWNPFIYGKDGKKQFYQRQFVWTLSDNQLLIESVYEGIDCGKILVRKRGWKEIEKLAASGETELAFNDLVDGKQRLNAIRGFLQNEYPDMHGNYFNDLSSNARRMFTRHQLFSYAEMPEDSLDANVITQFLKLNFAGVPQSKEHIEFVKSLTK